MLYNKTLYDNLILNIKNTHSWFIMGGGKIKRSLILVLLVTILLSVSAISAADTNTNNSVNSDNYQNVAVNTQTKSIANIESNSIENNVSNEYETITNVNSSKSDSSITKQSNSNNQVKKTLSENTTKQAVKINVNSITAYANQNIDITANVTYGNDELLDNAKVAIKLNGKTIGQTRLSNGSLNYSYVVPILRPTTYNMTIVVGETSSTLTGTKNFTLILQRRNIEITMTNFTALSASKISLNATVKYENGTLANGQKAVFKINGKTIGSTTVKNGIVSLNYIVPAKANVYPLILKIGESTLTTYNDSTVNLTVSKRQPKIDTDTLFFVKSGSTVTLKAKLTNTGNAYATGKVGFKINGKTIATVRLENGTASYKYNASKLKNGLYTVTIVYGGSSGLYEVRTNTSLRVQNDLVSTYTYSQLLEKANLTYEFIIKNKKLPNFATMNGNEVSMADLLYMFSMVLSYNDSYHNGGFSTPTKNTATSAYYVQVSQEDYVSLAKTIVQSYITNGQAPNTIKTKSGVTLSFEDTVYAFTRTVAFIYSNGVLSNYVTIVKLGEIPGISSSTSTTSNYVSNNTVPSGYEKYLVDAKNAYVNSSQLKNAVQKAVSNVTSLYSQAVAIYNYVNDITDYSSYSNTKYGAIKTLQYKLGNCVDQSHLLLGMYRTALIPARYCHATCTFRSGLVVGHVWVEVYVNGKWYSCDTTSNQNTFGNIVNWYKSTTVKRYTEIFF